LELLVNDQLKLSHALFTDLSLSLFKWLNRIIVYRLVGLILGICARFKVTATSTRDGIVRLVYLLNDDLVEVPQKVLQLFGVNKWLAVALKSFLRFAMVEEVAEVYVEEFSSRVVEHEVPRMSVSNPEHIGGDTLAS
jgi:hypothetical protein